MIKFESEIHRVPATRPYILIFVEQLNAQEEFVIIYTYFYFLIFLLK